MSTAMPVEKRESDPITEALPPNSDYITYLTVLEYQLTPERVSTLTKHLTADDGTLAKEIGWDLVRLVLPLLSKAPTDAEKCLESISRRGNPREVIVRVGESLEALCVDDDGLEDGSTLDASDDLPTFAGEAEPVHLGEMKLDGLPESKKGKEAEKETLVEEESPMMDEDSGLSQQFASLLSMLSVLHPRVRTQYPSRFLATSLPAALGAYRRIPITLETTTAFLGLLGKLSGKQRPILPPRSSTASVNKIQPSQQIEGHVYAPLPDPEGASEENSKSPSALENSIVQRLLQAVMLEVLEEYLLSLPNGMEWATRWLEGRGSIKVPPTRVGRFQMWQTEKDLASIDGEVRKFERLAKDLALDPDECFRATNLPLVSGQRPEDVLSSPVEEKDDEEASEFPNSPDQIPCSHLGALFLFLAKRAPPYQAEPPQRALEVPASDIHHFINQFVLPTQTTPEHPPFPSVMHNPPAAIDALLALLALTKMPSPNTPANEQDYKSIIHTLSYLSAQHPDPNLRSAAHFLATQLLQTQPSPPFRLDVIKSTLSTPPPFEALHEIGINWLKSELLTNTDPSLSSEPSSPFSNFVDDPALTTLLFPRSPPPRDPTDSTSTPSTQSTYSTTAIATLNLLYLLLTHPSLGTRFNLGPQLTSTSDSGNPFATKAKAFLRGTREAVDKDSRNEKTREQVDEDGDGDGDEVGEEVGVPFGVLEIALARVESVLENEEKKEKKV